MDNELTDAALVAPQLDSSTAVQQGSQEQAHLPGHLNQHQDDGDLHRPIFSKKATGKELRYVYVFLLLMYLPWLINPNGSSGVPNRYLDFQRVRPSVSVSVLLVSYLDEKWNKTVSKILPWCAIGLLGTVSLIIDVIIGTVTKVKPPTTRLKILLVAVFVIGLVLSISIGGVVAFKRKVNAGDMENRITFPNANEGSSIFPLPKGDMKKIFNHIAGLSATYLTYPSWGSVNVLQFILQYIQLTCACLAFCSSLGMLSYLIIDDMKNQPSTTVPNMMAPLGLVAALASFIFFITCMIENVPLTSLLVCVVCLVVIFIIKFTGKKPT